MKIFKEDKLFVVIVLIILIAGLYFFATCISIEYTSRKDYTGKEYTSDMGIFPAENHEQAVEVYNELQSVLYNKNLFMENKKGLVDRLPLTVGWELEENENEVFILYQKSKVASITEISDFAYGSNSQMIVSNWIGMHAFIAEETRIAETSEGDRIDKVLINIEPSAAEEISGAKMVQELHYFYVASDNSFMDIILLDDDYMLELEEWLCGLYEDI